MSNSNGMRIDDFLPLALYGVIGDGRSVALCGADGSIDWWCVPQLDAPPYFDRLLDPELGGYFSIAPREPFTVERSYRARSNVLETVFVAGSARARLSESLNSGSAGRLPWSELARRLEGIEGEMLFDVVFRPGSRGRTATAWLEENVNWPVFHLDGVNSILRYDENFDITASCDREITGVVATFAGSKATIAVLADRDRPLIRSSITDIDRRIDGSDRAWREWADSLTYEGEYEDCVRRSALAMKLLLYTPSGAIAAAATTSLPERIGGKKNYDYRFGWVRDAAYTIKAFLEVGALAEVQSAFAWVLDTVRRHGPTIYPFYQLDGTFPDGPRLIGIPGYLGMGEVHRSNSAREQFQLGLFGDILETTWQFVRHGHLLDEATRRLIEQIVDGCADQWLRPDAGIWELEEQQHYTNSKINCWVALSRASDLAEKGHLDTTHGKRWRRERDRIGTWIDEHCWNESKKAYVMYPGSDKLDASILLGVRFGFDRHERLRATLDAVVGELGRDELVYRYSGMPEEEGTFIACAYWVAESYALLGDLAEAKRRMDALETTLSENLGVLNEMIDPTTHEMLGNMPQCFSHLAMIHAAVSINEAKANATEHKLPYRDAAFGPSK